jgi:sporulation protein YlmC with PRC-barrel domain
MEIDGRQRGDSGPCLTSIDHHGGARERGMGRRLHRPDPEEFAMNTFQAISKRIKRNRLMAVAIICAATATFVFISTSVAPVRSQGIELVKVDISVVGQGYRASKLMGNNVVNEKNEKIGTLDDLIIGHDKSLFAVLQVGGFLGLGSRLVALPYDSLQIDETGRKIELPGATKEQLQKLVEFKYLT